MTDGVSNNARQKRTEQERERERDREREREGEGEEAKDRCIGNWPGNCSHLHIENLDKLSVPRSADFFWATGKTMMRL